MNDLRNLADRLLVVYSGSKRLEELQFPGLAKRAQQLGTLNPNKYAQIATDLMDGVAVKKIAKDQHVAPELVQFIRQMHPELAHAARAQLVVNLEETAIAMAQRLTAEVEGLNLDKLPNNLSTVLDKLALLTGGVTNRTEHVSAPKAEDVQRMFAALGQVKDIK